jgi:hypothetical protein
MVARMPGEGFEPPTFGLQNRCTTTVLTRLLSEAGDPKSEENGDCGLIGDYIGCLGDDPDVLDFAGLLSRDCFKFMQTRAVGGERAGTMQPHRTCPLAMVASCSVGGLGQLVRSHGTNLENLF